MHATTEATALQFRSAAPSDVDAVVALVESAYRGEASRAGWTTEADLLDGRRTGADEVALLVEDADGMLLLAERDGVLLASAHLRRQAGVAHFGMFAVRPQLQGSGLGRAVLAHAEHIASQQWQCARMQMTVIVQRTELIAWYQRRGYRRTGTLLPFPYGDARFGQPRREDLRFEVLEKSLDPHC